MSGQAVSNYSMIFLAANHSHIISPQKFHLLLTVLHLIWISSNIFPRNFTESTSPTAKSTSPRLLDTTFYAHWESWTFLFLFHRPVTDQSVGYAKTVTLVVLSFYQPWQLAISFDPHWLSANSLAWACCLINCLLVPSCWWNHGIEPFWWATEVELHNHTLPYSASHLTIAT